MKFFYIWKETLLPLNATAVKQARKERVSDSQCAQAREKGCCEEEKRQVQHFGITLQQLWRSNEQPSWFTVQDEGEREIGRNRWARVWRTEHMKRKSILDEKQLEWKNKENAAKGHKKGEDTANEG